MHDWSLLDLLELGAFNCKKIITLTFRLDYKSRLLQVSCRTKLTVALSFKNSAVEITPSAYKAACRRSRCLVRMEFEQ